MSDTFTPGQNFEDAFAAFLTDQPPAQDTESPPKAEADASPAEAAPEQAPETAPAAEPVQEQVQEAEQVEEQAPEAEAAPEPAPESNQDLLNRLAEMLKQPAPKAEEPKQQAQPQQPAEEPVYTPEEQQFLQDYEKEWPDIVKAERLIRRGEYRAMVGYVFQEVAKELKPLLETVQTLAERNHLSDLKSSVSDYDVVREKVIDWVGTQPTYLQMAYKHVIENGTADEVTDLINRYKRESGAAPTPRPVAHRKTELPPATKQAAAALAPVGSKRSAVPQALDPQNFDQAFAEFADKV